MHLSDSDKAEASKDDGPCSEEHSPPESLPQPSTEQVLLFFYFLKGYFMKNLRSDGHLISKELQFRIEVKSN